MESDDTEMLRQLPTGDSPSDSPGTATHTTGTFNKPDFANMEGAADPDLQNDVDVSTATYNFVAMLATDLSAKELALPSWPEVVVKTKVALVDEDGSERRLARLVGTEPVLAAGLLRAANSERPVDTDQASDLRTAVESLGFTRARSLAISLATTQIGNSQAIRQVKAYVADLWQHSNQVAAIANIVAKKYTTINPDEAHLAGLLHDIGKLYVLTRAQNEPVLCDCETTLQEVMHAWHTSIGAAILESWEFSENLVAAVRDHELCDIEGTRSANLTDVISVANLLANQQRAEPRDQVDLNKVPACRRLKLHAGISIEIIRVAEMEIRALHQVIGI